MKFYDEGDGLINIQHVEKSEQDLAEEFIESDDIVLELGARYGTVSYQIAKKLSDPKHLVAVEPQYQVHQALEKNRNNSNYPFIIHKGFVSKQYLRLEDIGYGTSYIHGESPAFPCITLEELQDLHKLQFNTLVADCEGGLQPFFEDFPWFYKQLNKVILEKDYPDKCDYSVICNNLIKEGLVLVKSINGGFHEVYVRPNSPAPSRGLLRPV